MTKALIKTTISQKINILTMFSRSGRLKTSFVFPFYGSLIIAIKISLKNQPLIN